MSNADLATRIEAELAKAGLDGCVHGMDIDTGTQVSFRGDQLCVAASTGKFPILVALMRAVDAGQADLDERLVIGAENRTPGPTGLSVMTRPCELALGDVAQLMISISDNHATDLVLSRVPPPLVTADMRDLGLAVTALDMTISDEHQRLTADAASSRLDLRPEAAAWRTTPAEMCALLRLVWLDQAAEPGQCSRIRDTLRSCLTSNGFDSWLPIAGGIGLANKTGTRLLADQTAGISLVRNEIGVFEYADGGRYAIAAYTHQTGSNPVLRDPAISAAFAALAQITLNSLRAAKANQPAPGSKDD